MSDYNDELTVEPTRFEQIPHWVMDHPEITGNSIRVYLQLRRRSNGKSVSWPSRKCLSEDLSMNVKTVDAAIAVLIAMNAISVSERRTADGKRTSNLYTVRWEVKNTSPVPEKRVVPLPENWVVPLPEKRYRNLYPIELTQTELKQEISRQKFPDVANAFDEFWNAYPRKAGKTQARLSFAKATKTVDPQVIITAAERFSLDPNREDQFTPHPTTWLNQGRWEDEPLPSKGSKFQDTMNDIYKATQRERNLFA